MHPTKPPYPRRPQGYRPPPGPPPTIAAIAQRYQACAEAFAATFHVPLMEALTSHHEAIASIFIEASRSGAICPASSNGHKPGDQPGAAESKPETKQTTMLKVLFALVKSLHLSEETLKAQMQTRGYGDRYKELTIEQIQTLVNYYQGVKKAREGKAPNAVEREGDVSDFAPKSPPEDSEKSPADEMSTPNEAEKKPAHPSTGSVPRPTPPPLTADQDALKDEATAWGLPHKEIIDVIRRYDLAIARNLLWQAKELRRKASKQGALA